MNKNNSLRAFFMVLFLVTASIFRAQTGVQVQFYSGSPQNYAVEDSGKLYFSGDNLLIKTSATATDVTIPVNIISKVIFTESALATSEVGSNLSSLVLYPNPSSDYIKIKSPKAEKISVAIYSTSGQLVQKGTYSSDATIDVSKLQQGVYLVQANGTTIKFIKK